MKNDRALQRIGELVKGSRDTAVEKVKGLLTRQRELEKELQQLKQKLASAAGADMAANAVEVAGVKLLATQLDGVDPKSLRDLVDQLKQKLGSGVILLATEADGKIALAAGVTKDLTGKVKAGDLLKMVAEQVGGRGGGRPDFAQGGGTDLAALPGAIHSVENWLISQM